MSETYKSEDTDVSDREIDLDIVSASWRSLTHSDSYEHLLQAWDRKLSKGRKETRDNTFVDRVLARQLGSIEKLLADDVQLSVSDPIEAAIQSTAAPAMAISPQGIAVLLGSKAGEFFGVGQGLPVGRAWLRSDSVSNFEAFLKRSQNQTNASYAIVRVVSPSGKESIAEVFPSEEDKHGVSYIIVRSLELAWTKEVSENLSQAFGLSDAETEICRLLFQLRETDAIAGERGVQRQTIRTQLKSIFLKTEARSKVELIRMLGLVCARAAAKQKSGPLVYIDPTNNERIMRRKDGRELAYTWTGADDGEPIVYAPGAIPYFMYHSPVREALRNHGLKLITISLPGHGNSAAAVEPVLEDGTDAIIELCDHLGLRGVAGWSTYAGHLFLSRASSLRPDLFRAHLSIGVNWNLNEKRIHSLPIIQRTLANLARLAPPLFELVCGIGFRRMIQEGPDFFLKRNFDSISADRQSIQDPELQAPLRLACQHLTNQGLKPFVQMQSMVASTQIQNWMQHVDIPVHYLIPMDVEKLAEEDLTDVRSLGKNVTAEVVINAGELLPYQTPDLFIERLVDLVSSNPGATFAQREQASITESNRFPSKA